MIASAAAIAAAPIGCAHHREEQRERGRSDAAPPPGSGFARIHEDMPQQMVVNLIGNPTSVRNHRTGKAWIPFYFGTDHYRIIWHYKNQGRIEFSGGMDPRVLEILFDPAEPGY